MAATVFDTVSTFNRFSNRIVPIFTGKLLPVLVLTVITILYSRKLTYYDYGQFQTVWLYCNIISVIISFGLSAVILSTGINYIAGFLKNNRLKISILYVAGMLITFTIFYFTTSRFPSATKLLLVAFIILQSVCTLTDTLLIKNNLLKAYLWLNLMYTLVFFAIHLYFFYHNFELNYLITGIICLSILKASAVFFIRLEAAETDLPKPPGNFITNWLFIGLNEVAGIIARWLDKLFLLFLLSPAEFAIFFNGAIEIPLFGILISAMENIMLINISSNISDKKGAENIFKESFKILSLVAFPLFFLLLTMHTAGFAIIFKDRYNASIPVFLISIFIIPVRITHYGVLLQCYGQSKKIVVGSVMDIGISLTLMFILYPWLGTPGVALAIVLSTYLQAGYYLWQSARLMGAKISALVPGFFLLRLWCALAAVYGLFYYVKNYFSGLTSLIAVFIITALIIFGGLIFYWRKPNYDI